MFKTNDTITDGITTGVEVRQQRGMEIAAMARIERQGKCFVVPSVTNPRPTKYKVTFGANQSCTCPDHELRKCKCKHIYAVEYFIRREMTTDGTTTTVTESLTVTKTRKTYAQNWPAYNAAQVGEKQKFQTMLYELCKGIGELPETGAVKGRPRIPLADAVFAAVSKVFSTVSARRFVADLCDAQAKGFVSKVPHFNSILNYLEMPELLPILTAMIERAALPLRSVESQFAVDSTGFTACRFVRWYDVKYNRFTSEQQWVKTHLMCGVKTNVVTSVEIHGMNTGDAPILPSLVDATARNFTLSEVSADKGYSSRANHDAIEKHGATAFIAFKANTTGEAGGAFAKMFHYFNFQRDEFLAHYHQRSNVESTVMMIKSKFGDSLRSKSETAMKNEVLCKVLCHNLCCLNSAIHELGIEPVLGMAN